MKWVTPKCVDLADRQNTLNAVGFSNCGTTSGRGSACQDGSSHALLCTTGGVASLFTGGHTDGSINTPAPGC